jgi:hypothetical protein
MEWQQSPALAQLPSRKSIGPLRLDQSQSPRCAMKTHVLKGSKQEIAQRIAQLSGEVREAIVFVDEPNPAEHGAATPDTSDIFAEMRPFMVDVPDVDDSREAIYTAVEGE